MNKIYVLFIVFTVFIVYGCSSDEEISGCMDPESSNFSSSATLDDGSCRFFADEYVGMYDIATTNCSPSMGFFEDLSVSILKTRTAGPNDLGFVINGILSNAGESVNFTSVATNSGIDIDGGDGLRSRMAIDAFVWNGISYIAFWFELTGSLSFDGEELTGRLKLTGTDVLDEVNQTVVLSFTCDYRLIPR